MIQYPSATIKVMAEACLKVSGSAIRDHYELQCLQSSRKPLDNFYHNLHQRITERLNEALMRARPEFGFYDSSSVEEGDFWLLSILENAKNFQHSLPFFSLAIAHVKRESQGHNETISSLIMCPVLKEIYFAEKDKGAWFCSFEFSQDKPQMIKTSGRVAKEDMLVATNTTNLPLAQAQLRNLGSDALSIVYTAAGKFDAAVIDSPIYQNNAAALLIAKEAGLKIQAVSNTLYVGTDAFMKLFTSLES